MKIRAEHELRGYQRYLIRRGTRQRRIYFAVDVGLGKSVSAATVIRNRRNRGGGRVLIVAPKRVAEETWPTEFNEWRHLRGIPFRVIAGTPGERMRALKDRRAHVHIISKDNLQWLWKTLRAGADWDYEGVVIDEASMLNSGRKRTKRAGGGKGSMPLARFGIVARMRALTKWMILLSGSPAPEGVHNWWGPIYCLDGGERLGTSRTAFENRWFDKGYMGWDMNPRPGAQKQIMSRISDLVVSLEADDYLELPPLVTTPTTDRWVTLPKELMKEYRRFERDLFTEQYDVEAASNGVLTNKLLQFANGSLYREKGNAVPVHELKGLALRELVEELGGSPLLLAINYRFDRTLIKKMLGKKVTLLEDAGKRWMSDWNKGRITVLAAHPASLGHGLNMQFGGHTLGWFGVCHSGELYRQFNGRVRRSGQKADRCFVYHLLTRGTWDEQSMANQADKQGSEKADRRAVAIRRADILRELSEA